ncbi:MAG: thiamine pyrophosphate-binding protein [Rhodobacteraceae bacterium]|nr:thiamine pyrophosphate-binding protein [Paracoccaceae bacterium]
MRHGGQILVDQLLIQGVDRVFSIPGESYLAALDGLYESSIDVIVGRQEGGVAMMAEAHGKLTGKPGIAFVTRGPGATNASAGVHIALQDSTPMVLFVGQVASDQRDREAFQEVDYRQMFAPLAKWVAEIERTDRIPEYVSRAFHVAQSGRPGPVVLALPEDMLSAEVHVQDTYEAIPAKQMVSYQAVRDVIERLKSAKNPFVIVGGGGWSTQAAIDLGRFASSLGLAVGTSFRCQDYMDNRHPNYVGDVAISPNPELAERVRNADCVLVLGARLGEMTSSGYTLFKVPNPKQKLIHVHAGPDELGRVYQPEIGLACRAADFVAVAAKLTKGMVQKSPIHAKESYTKWQEPFETPGDVKMEEVICHMKDVLPDNAIIANGAGNYAGWIHRYYSFRSYRTQLAPTSGSMGYGLPAAIAAKLQYPEREVICLAGDGCFQMTMQEFGTALQYGIKLIVIVVNNGVYGTIRMHQQRDYPGRPSGTTIVNPNFADFAACYGCSGVIVTKTKDFNSALERARSAKKSTIIELRTDPTAVTTKSTVFKSF